MCAEAARGTASYFNGGAAKLDHLIELYITNSKLVQSRLLRNAPAEFANMSLTEDEVAALVAFCTG